MSKALSPSFVCCYGLARVARVWKISRASVYRSLKETPPNTSARRPGPVGACSDAELADHIRRQIDASRLHGEGYRKLWARLRFAGVRASPRRVRRVMRENGLLAPHRVGRTKAKPHDGTIITDKVNEMWGTDMTQTITIREGRANVFVAVEHANSEVIGIHASRSANRFEALEPVRQGVHRCFGAIAPGVARGLKLRHDHGSNYMSGDFQDEIECLGIEASPSFVREPEGNGVAERFIRTLKENLLWVRTFVTMMSRAGVERILAFLGPGALVGELAIIDGRPRSASVVAVREAALAQLLRSLPESTPRSIGQGDLAAMTGIARENLSRVFNDWRRRKLVSRLSGYYCLGCLALPSSHARGPTMDC